MVIYLWHTFIRNQANMTTASLTTALGRWCCYRIRPRRSRRFDFANPLARGRLRCGKSCNPTGGEGHARQCGLTALCSACAAPLHVRCMCKRCSRRAQAPGPAVYEYGQYESLCGNLGVRHCRLVRTGQCVVAGSSQPSLLGWRHARTIRAWGFHACPGAQQPRAARPSWPYLACLHGLACLAFRTNAFDGCMTVTCFRVAVEEGFVQCMHKRRMHAASRHARCSQVVSPRSNCPPGATNRPACNCNFTARAHKWHTGRPLAAAGTRVANQPHIYAPRLQGLLPCPLFA